jgi:hypothetical protein
LIISSGTSDGCARCLGDRGGRRHLERPQPHHAGGIGFAARPQHGSRNRDVVHEQAAGEQLLRGQDFIVSFSGCDGVRRLLTGCAHGSELPSYFEGRADQASS